MLMAGLTMLKTAHEGDGTCTGGLLSDSESGLLRQCMVCALWKDPSMMAPHRRQCRTCRNRYTQKVRDPDKLRINSARRMRKHRLLKRLASADSAEACVAKLT